MDAICQNIDGLQKISGERIFSELKKTVQGKFGIELFVKLIECGAAPYIGINHLINNIAIWAQIIYMNISSFFSMKIGFPANSECHEIHRLKQIVETTFAGVSINPITILSALINTENEALSLHSRLKLSAYERDLLYFLASYKHDSYNNDSLL